MAGKHGVGRAYQKQKNIVHEITACVGVCYLPSKKERKPSSHEPHLLIDKTTQAPEEAHREESTTSSLSCRPVGGICLYRPLQSSSADQLPII